MDPLRALPPGGELLSRDQQQTPFLHCEFLLQLIQRNPHVVVGDHEEVVVVIVIPPGHLADRAVPIGGVGVGVKIAFEPLHICQLLLLGTIIPVRQGPGCR